MRIFETFARSWEFTKISYRIIWDHKQLLLFPVMSAIAAILVLASFILPLWGTGTIEQWLEQAERIEEAGGTGAGSAEIMMWVTLFLFYFANYFVIVFFNSALTGSAMQVMREETPSLGYGLSMASKRLPQIVGWALVSAVVGVILKMIENANEKAGAFIAAILGSAWTALTYFVVPVIVMEGANPMKAFKQSNRIMGDTWGTALVGNFSLGFVSFLLMLPAVLIAIALTVFGVQSGSTALMVTAIALGVILVMVVAAATAAADGVFKAVLYTYATGKIMPESIDSTRLDEAFRGKD